MRVIAEITERARALFRGARQDAETNEELADHVERDVAERVRAGEDPAAARRAARLALGGMAQQRELVRDARGVRPLEELIADVRYALRALRKNPGFAATAILVLALGIGATTAAFSVVYATFVAALPYPSSERIVTVAERNSPTNTWNISTADATAIRAEQRSFDAWGEVSMSQAELGGTSTPERAAVGRASAGFFRVLGVAVASGRGIGVDDESADAAPVAVVSSAFADRALGGVTNAIGRTVTVDGIAHQVIGVLPAGREVLSGYRAGVWTPLKLRAPLRRGPFTMRGFGRLKPGVSLDAAARDLAAISGRLDRAYSDFRDTTAMLTPFALRSALIGTTGSSLAVFGGAAALVLLLAIVNVATLVLVRTSTRSAELGVRITLGARPRRVARLLVTENVVLTLAAALLGIALAAVGITLANLLIPGLERLPAVALDGRAVAFAVGAALVAGLAVSLSPMVLVTRHVAGALRSDQRRSGGTRRSQRVRSALVAAEFALALPLLAGAGLLVNSFVRLQRVEPGFDVHGVVAAGISLPAGRYSDADAIRRFWILADQRLRAIPGVSGVGFASNIPPDRGDNTNNFNLVDHPVTTGQAEPVSPWFTASEGYFAALGVRVREGRAFTASDTVNPVVVVSASWARHFFPNEDPVGRQLVEGGCYDCPRTTIVGVVDDVKNFGPARVDETVYTPMNVSGERFMYAVIRGRDTDAATLRAVAAAMATIDPQLPLVTSTFADRMHGSLDDSRRWTALLTAFAGVGVLLAALGVFGLMSYVVRQRRREIGVRLALGADPASVVRWTVQRGMRYALAGTAVGILLTVVVARRLDALLYHVSATDPSTLVLVCAALLAVAAAACWIPGWAASRISPQVALSGD